MKKKLIAALAVMSIAVAGLTACGGSETKETEAVAEYERGTSSETGWESAWMGLKFTAGDGIVMQDEAAMDEVLAAGSEELGSDVEDLDDLYTYEMMASDETMGVPSVAMIVEKSPLTPDEYIEQMVEQLETATTSIEMTQDGDITDYELGGLTFRRLQLKANSQGVEMIQDYLICQRGDYLIEVIATALSDQTEERDAMLASFSALE